MPETVINRFDTILNAELVAVNDFYALKMNFIQRTDCTFNTTVYLNTVKAADLLNLSDIFKKLADQIQE